MDLFIKWAVLIAVMALSTYLIRMIPFVFFRKKIKSRFIKSMIYYMPYSILTAMTVPGIFFITENIYVALVGFAVAMILALFNRSLITISLCSSVSALAVWIVITYLI